MRTLIADPTLLDATLATLEPGVTTDVGWTREYSDPSTGSLWQLTYLLSHLQGGGYRCLIRMPMPTRAGLIAILCDSNAPDEVWAAGILLQHDPESYPELLDALQQMARVGDWARMRRGIKASGIASGVNRRAHVGQTVAEIGRDAAHFAALAERSRELAAQARAALGPDARSTADRVASPWAG